MAGVHECSICNNTYSDCDRKPRVLQCGHTYCQPCLQDVVSQGSPACPSCRRDIVSPVAELPVVFSLIPASGSGGAASKNGVGDDLLCSSHQNELDFLCTECKVAICKKCLVEAHAHHKLILMEEIFADEQILADLKSHINTDIEQTESYLGALDRMEPLLSKIDEIRSSFPSWKESLLQHQSSLSDCASVMDNISTGLSLEQKNVLLNALKTQNKKLSEVKKGFKFFEDLASQFQGSKLSGALQGGGRPCESVAAPVDYMPDGRMWEIITDEEADRAVRTMKETDHRPLKAVVRSTDESPILCLFELLQYLVASSVTMELELLDTAQKKMPSSENNHCPEDFKTRYQLKTLFNTLIHFQSLAAAKASFGSVMDASSQNKVVAFVYPESCSYDLNVLAFGKVAKKDGSWPLPLEIHFINSRSDHLPWLERFLPPLYASAQPSLGECRVYVPGGGWLCGPGALFPLLAELGRKYSTQHRLYLDKSRMNVPGQYLSDGYGTYDEDCRQWSAHDNVPYEYKDF